VLGIAIALAGACVWGGSDFIGGLMSRRLPALSVLVVVEVAGLVGVGLAVAIVRPPVPEVAQILPAVGAGVAGSLGLGAFYRALAVGQMSIVAPISALGAVVPVIAGVAGGDHLSAVVAVGLALALAGVMLASREAEDEAEADPEKSRGIGLALVAALCLGLFLWGSAAAEEGGALWAGLSSRVGAVPVAVAAVLITRTPLPRRGRDVAILSFSGQLDIGASVLFVAAAGVASVAIVGVIASLYPVVTVLLARFVLGERLARAQAVGVAVVFAGVALVAGGSA
jgi:drug/metabolite transporter (DMT)-like permease